MIGTIDIEIKVTTPDTGRLIGRERLSIAGDLSLIIDSLKPIAVKTLAQRAHASLVVQWDLSGLREQEDTQ